MIDGKRILVVPSKNMKAVDSFLSSKGIPCPYVQISDPQGQQTVAQLEAWALINNDLLNASHFLQLLLQRKEDHPEVGYMTNDGLPDDITGQSLLYSAIITYAKTFNESRNRQIRLNPKLISTYTPTIMATHKSMIQMRNKYIAHGDESVYEQASVRIALSPDLSQKGIVSVYYATYSTATIARDDLESYLNVIILATDYVKSKIASSFDLIRSKIESYSLDELYKNATFPPEQSRRSKR